MSILTMSTLDKRDEFFTGIKNAQSLAERERIAAEWLRAISSEDVILLDEFPRDCAAFFGATAYCIDDAKTADLIGRAIHGAYIIGQVSRH